MMTCYIHPKKCMQTENTVYKQVCSHACVQLKGGGRENREKKEVNY